MGDPTSFTFLWPTMLWLLVAVPLEQVAPGTDCDQRRQTETSDQRRGDGTEDRTRAVINLGVLRELCTCNRADDVLDHA